MQSQLNKIDDDALDAIFSALADPTRRALMIAMTDGEKKVTDLAEPFDMTLANVSKHLRVLEDAGLVNRRSQGRQSLCSLDGEALAPITAWLAHYRKFWTQRIEALEALLDKPGGKRPTGRKR